MIRTQIYLDPQTHKKLLRLAEAQGTSMSHVIRAAVKDKVEKEENKDTSGIAVLQNLIDHAVTGGPKDLSYNIDHYLYGAPKKKLPKRKK